MGLICCLSLKPDESTFAVFWRHTRFTSSALQTHADNRSSHTSDHNNRDCGFDRILTGINQLPPPDRAKSTWIHPLSSRTLP